MPLLAMRFGGVVFGLVCVTAVAGCDVVFGLDHLEPGQAARPDAAEPRVHGRLWERYVTNGSDLSPLVLERTYPATSVALRGDRDDQPYRLVITVDGLPNEYQLDAPELAIPQIVAGRPDAAPLGKSLLQFSYAPQVVDLKAAQVASTGVYSLTNTGAYGPVVTMDWRTAAPTANARLGMLDARTQRWHVRLSAGCCSQRRPRCWWCLISSPGSARVTTESKITAYSTRCWNEF